LPDARQPGEVVRRWSNGVNLDRFQLATGHGNWIGDDQKTNGSPVAPV
jgi:hypothetical protein